MKAVLHCVPDSKFPASTIMWWTAEGHTFSFVLVSLLHLSLAKRLHLASNTEMLQRTQVMIETEHECNQTGLESYGAAKFSDIFERRIVSKDTTGC